MNVDYVTIQKEDIKLLATKGISNLTVVALYCKIRSMAKETGSCKASNAYFADFFNISERQISRNLTVLTDAQLITINLERQGKQVVERSIRLLDTYFQTSTSRSILPEVDFQKYVSPQDISGSDYHECLGSNNMSFGASHQGDKKETKETYEKDNGTFA